MVAKDYFVRRNDLDDSEKDPFVFFEVDKTQFQALKWPLEVMQSLRSGRRKGNFA